MKIKYFIPMLFCILPLGSLSACAGESKLTQQQHAIIFLVLQHTSEVAIHQMRGETGNQVYVHEDGHKEAVYNASGRLVQDGINDGSYNYRHPYFEPLLHFQEDTHPWLSLGSTPHDPTSPSERISAYVQDLGNGIQAAKNYKGALHTGDYSRRQQKVLKQWAKLMPKNSDCNIFTFFETDTPITDKDLTVILAMIEANMALEYGAVKPQHTQSLRKASTLE